MASFAQISTKQALKSTIFFNSPERPKNWPNVKSFHFRQTVSTRPNGNHAFSLINPLDFFGEFSFQADLEKEITKELLKKLNIWEFFIIAENYLHRTLQNKKINSCHKEFKSLKTFFEIFI